MSETTPARGASDLDALRAAVQRIEDGESTGLFDDLPPAPSRGSRTRERGGSKGAGKRSGGGRGPTRAQTGGSVPIPTTSPAQEWQGSAPPPETAPDWAQPDPEAAPTFEAVPVPDAVAGADQEGGVDKEGEVEKDRDADPYAVARQIVLRQLTMSPKSRHQLRQKLRQRNCPDDVAEAVLDRMTEVGLVDDAKYAEALVRSKQVSRGLSKRALAHELRQKGVDKDTADSVLDQVDPTEEEDRAKALVAARMPRLRGMERDTVMRRLAGMLARKGYPSGLSLQVIREAIDADPAFRRD